MKLTTRLAYSIFPSYVWEILKKESALTWCRWSMRWRLGVRPVNRLMIEKLMIERGRKIHLGCGLRTFPSWVNIDTGRLGRPDLRWDLRQVLPFEVDSARLIYSEHL